MTTDERLTEVRHTAKTLYSLAPDWVTFYREILGMQGIVRRNFPTRDSFIEFEKSETFQQIQQMLSKLREQGPVPGNPEEPTRVVTVRLPQSLHESLRIEAHEHQTSMNKLCISKLLQFIDGQMVPAEIWQPKPAATRSQNI